MSISEQISGTAGMEEVQQWLYSGAKCSSACHYPDQHSSWVPRTGDCVGNILLSIRSWLNVTSTSWHLKGKEITVSQPWESSDHQFISARLKPVESTMQVCHLRIFFVPVLSWTGFKLPWGQWLRQPKDLCEHLPLGFHLLHKLGKVFKPCGAPCPA